MSFFLLGKYPDDRLELLSDVAFATRQDALVELSHLTASPEFQAWDSEVVVIDSDLGTPVVLVRPSAVETPAEEPVPTGDQPAIETDPVAEEPDEALAAVLLDLGVDSEAPSPEVPLEPDSVDEEPAAAATEAIEVEPTAAGDSTFVGEGDEEAIAVDPAWAQAVVATSDQTAEDSLKDALKRTAAHMEAEGITAPESVGPGETVLLEQPAEEATADDEPASAEMPSGEQHEPESEVDAETVADFVAEASAEEVRPVFEEVSPPVEAESGQQTADEAPAATAAWPWDTLVDSDSASELSGLEAPGPDDESMIRALADDEASRTVVLGEYGDTPAPEDAAASADVGAASEPETVVEQPTPPAESDPETAAAVDEAPAAEQPEDLLPESPAEEPDPVPLAEEPTSDFIELGEVVAPEPVKAYEPGDVDIDGMTCDDCVYVDTCPNKDEREPTTCGSFQWK